jgi:tetratricopeptide (TPR) repeat protein
MKIKRLLAAFLYLTFSGVCITAAPDNLIALKQSADVTQRIDGLNQLASGYLPAKVDSTALMALEAYQLAEKAGYESGIYASATTLVEAFRRMGKYEESADYLNRLLRLEFVNADPQKLFNVMHLLADSYRLQSRYNDAIYYGFQALSLAENIRDSHNIVTVTNTIGNVYMEMGNIGKALEYFEKAHQMAQSTNDYPMISGTGISLGNIYTSTGDYGRAISYYRKSREISYIIGDKPLIQQAYSKIGNIYMLRGEDDKSIESLNQALRFAQDLNDMESIATAFFYLGQTYLSMNNIPKSLDMFYMSLQIADSTGMLGHKIRIKEELVAVYRRINDLPLAVRYLGELLLLKDSLNNLQVEAMVAETEARYQLDKKLQENDLLKREIEIRDLHLRQQALVARSLAAFSFVILLAALLIVQWYKLSSARKSAVIEQKLFRTQMNPHFIFNALIAIQGFMYQNDATKAARYLSNFARLIRMVLTNSREEFITLENEVRTLEYYLQLQQLRFDHKFDFIIRVDESLRQDFITIPPMLAQPFIENSIEHGIQHIARHGHINVSFTKEKDTILFIVEDNGVGINHSRAVNQQKTMKHESLAFIITEERLRTLNKFKNRKIKFKISESEQADNQTKGTIVSFSIPFKNINES